MIPSHTASKHRSSQVIITSYRSLFSCHRSGAGLICRFRSSIFSKPLAVYLPLTTFFYLELQARILFLEFLEDCVVWSTKRIYIGFVCCWPWKPHHTSRPIRRDIITRFPDNQPNYERSLPEYIVSFHGSILV